MREGEVRCSRCGGVLGQQNHVALISGRILGDECTDAYFWCTACEVYTLRLYRDVFAGPETAHDSAPLSKAEGDRRLELIHRCEKPYDERCRCQAHREYFGGWLD